MMVCRMMDTETVITEVKKRECLWNPHCVYYKNKLDKYRAWEEIARAIVGHKYEKCSPDEKSQIIRAIQSRWKTARDAYMKCRMTEQKKPTYKSRQHKYVYQEQLRFLEVVKAIEENKGRDNEKNSNSFIGENSTSQSAYGGSDDDSGKERDDVMEFDIDIHDDFKEHIKDVVTETESVTDNAVNNDTMQNPGTSSQNDQTDPLATDGTAKQKRKPRTIRPRKVKANMSEFEIKLLKILRSKNNMSPNTSALQADDQFFFNSLASLINNFDTHQKLKFRSKILEVVMEVGNIGSRVVEIKQERETYNFED